MVNYSVNVSSEGTGKEARLDDESRVLAQIMVHPSQPHKSAPPPFKTEPYLSTNAVQYIRQTVMRTGNP